MLLTSKVIELDILHELICTRSYVHKEWWMLQMRTLILLHLIGMVEVGVGGYDGIVLVSLDVVLRF